MLASLANGAPLLVRALTDTDPGTIYFFSSLPGMRYSNLVDNGVVFYVMIQRALAGGSAALGSARQVDCGQLAGTLSSAWKPLDEPSAAVHPSQRTIRAGLYSSGDVRFALNRPFSEDGSGVVTDEALAGLFQGLDFTRLDDAAGNSVSLASEIWRLFLIIMIVALIAEALFCIPERRAATLSVSVRHSSAATGRESATSQPLPAES